MDGLAGVAGRGTGKGLGPCHCCCVLRDAQMLVDMVVLGTGEVYLAMPMHVSVRCQVHGRSRSQCLVRGALQPSRRRWVGRAAVLLLRTCAGGRYGGRTSDSSLFESCVPVTVVANGWSAT